MKIVNGYGGSILLTPKEINFNDNISETYDTGKNSINKIYFFQNISNIDQEILYNIINETSLLETYSSDFLGSVDSFGLEYIYDNSKKQRIIRQNPVDALRFDTVVDNATIQWCAIRIKTDTNGDYFIYTDKIGTFDNPSLINLDSLQTIQGIDNIVTSIKIDIRDIVGEEL